MAGEKAIRRVITVKFCATPHHMGAASYGYCFGHATVEARGADADLVQDRVAAVNFSLALLHSRSCRSGEHPSQDLTEGVEIAEKKLA